MVETVETPDEDPRGDGSDPFRFDKYDVLEDPDGYWFHVTRRAVDVDTGDRYYYIQDATHTGAEWYHDEWAEEKFDPLGWSTTTKPAHENGFRVNGILCEQKRIEDWKGKACISDYECGECGEDTEGDADVIVWFKNRDVMSVTTDCQACGFETVHFDA